MMSDRLTQKQENFTQKIFNFVTAKLDIPDEKLLFVEHHLSHAASAIFCSPYKESAILTVDGVGEWTTATVGKATADWEGTGRNEIELFAEAKFPHSLGFLYTAFTQFLGFLEYGDEYKVMGLAPYGKPNYKNEIYKIVKTKIIKIIS